MLDCIVNPYIIDVIRHPPFFEFTLMAQIYELLELLNTLILSTMANIVTIDKETIADFLICLQKFIGHIKFLQHESQLYHNEIHRKSENYELVHLQNNSLFEFRKYSHQ